MNENISDKLSELNFHDSEIESFFIDSKRRCTLIINYYNWEGNQEENASWKWKKLKITFGFIAVLEWNAPDFINTPLVFEIFDIRLDEKLQELYEIEKSKKTRNPKYKSPLFVKAKNHLSITFLINSFDDGINEEYGYLRLIGSDIDLEWIDEGCYEGQIHIPIKGE